MAGRAQYLPDPVGRPWPGIGRPHVHDIRPNPDRWMSARARCSRPFQEELAIQSVVTALPYDQVKRPPDSYASGLRFRPSCHHNSPDRHRGRQPRGCPPATPPGMWVHTGRFKKLSSAESGKAQLLPDPRRLCQPVVALPARQVAAQLLHDLRALRSLARSPYRAVPCIRFLSISSQIAPSRLLPTIIFSLSIRREKTPHAVALRFTRRDQLETGLTPAGVPPHAGRTTQKASTKPAPSE